MFTCWPRIFIILSMMEFQVGINMLLHYINELQQCNILLLAVPTKKNVFVIQRQ